jgi:hypothetical protein|tara:strand:+ start:11835 stop:12071 length:237 start_codon:yes stop_codon:yes gene_type:complete
MPTVEDLIDEYVGRKARYTSPDGLTIEVTVMNVKSHFGRLDIEITPISGDGTKWVTTDKLEFARPSLNGSAPTDENLF